MEAASFNTTMKKEKLFKLITDFIKPAILAQGKFINFKNSVAILTQMEKMEFYDPELWGQALQKLERLIRFRNLVYIQEFYDTMLRSKNSGKNPIDLTKVLQKLNEKLKSRVDFRWRYDADENHFYTFEELKAKRDDYQFPEQSMFQKTRVHRERLERFNKTDDITNELAAKKRKLTLEKELEQLTFERFMKKKGLETKGALEESRFLEADEADFDEELLRMGSGKKKGKKGEKIEAKEEEGGEKDEGDLEEEEKKARKSEKDVEKQKLILEQKKKEKAKLGKGKNKAEMRRLREEGFEKEKNNE